MSMEAWTVEGLRVIELFGSCCLASVECDVDWVPTGR